MSPEAPSAAPLPPDCSSVVPQGDRQLHFSCRWHWLGLKDESLLSVCYLTHRFVHQMPAGDQPVTSHERLPLVHSHNVDFWTMGEGLIQQHQDKFISSMKNVCYCIFNVFIVTSFTCRMTEIFHIIDDVTQFFSMRRISLLTAKTSKSTLRGVFLH